MPTKKLAGYLVFISDLLAMNVALALIFWLRYHSGVSPETFDPARSLRHYVQLVFFLSLAGTAYFFFKGLYRDWSLHSRAVQVAVVSRDVTVFCFFVLAAVSGSYFIDAMRHHYLGQVLTSHRVALLFLYWLIVLAAVNGM